MKVVASHLNFLRFSRADAPLTSDVDGYPYTKFYCVGDEARLQLVVLQERSDEALSSAIVSALAVVEEGSGRQHAVSGAVAQREERAEDGAVALYVAVPTLYLPRATPLRLRLDLNTYSGWLALRTEPFCVAGEAGEAGQSVLLEAGNSANALGAYFKRNNGSAWSFTYRISGGFYPKGFTPHANDTIFQGEQASFEQLYSLPYGTERLVLGGARGIPDSLIQTLNHALSCDALTVNGVPYGKVEGSALEAAESERYPFRTWSIAVKAKVDPFVGFETSDTGTASLPSIRMDFPEGALPADGGDKMGSVSANRGWRVS
jgi:hypothetical protein